MSDVQFDFMVRTEGSLVLLLPVSDEARLWVSENLEPSRQMWGRAVTIEPRYFENVLCGVLDAGLSVGRWVDLQEAAEA